jgi:hypothetical protein
VSGRLRRILWAVAVAYLAFGGYILGRFANNAFPTFYLWRPLAAAIPFAVVVGLLAAWLVRSQAPLVAAAAVGLITFWGTATRHWWQVALLVAAWLALLVAFRMRGRRIPAVPSGASSVATAFVLVFFISGVARAIFSAEGPVAPVTAAHPATGPNVYLIMLDGYPRRDTLLNDLGIDNGPFEDALTARGFDVYDDSHTDRRYTDLTLMNLLTGTTEGVPLDTAPASEIQFMVRQALSDAILPKEAQQAGYEWDVIDSPAGHVTFAAGHHFQHGGINTFEDNMLAESALAPIFKTLLPEALTDSLRDHFSGSVQTLLSLVDPAAHRLVLAHLFQPHLPFLWDANGDPVPVPAYWPRENLFSAQIETMQMSLTDYSAAMKGDLATLNPKILDLVDQIVARDPGAVVVIFSDHGSRYSLDLKLTEWYHDFLAARTPDHPGLFSADPRPTNILRTLLPTYITGSPAP